MGKRKRATGDLWLVREIGGRFVDDYELHERKPTPNTCDTYKWPNGSLRKLCAKTFERTMPKKLHLALGGGPVKIVVMLESEADALRKRVRELEKA